MMNLLFPQPAVANNRYSPFVQNGHSGLNGCIFAAFSASRLRAAIAFISVSIVRSTPDDGTITLLIFDVCVDRKFDPCQARTDTHKVS